MFTRHLKEQTVSRRGVLRQSFGFLVKTNRPQPPVGDGCTTGRWRAELATQIERTEERSTSGILFREVNEYIAELSDDWVETGASSLVCECGDAGCVELLEIEPAEYERVRADGARFVVLAGHQLPEGERVVEQTDRFL